MRRDAKLGLALGMLAIGFAVAFCFPRQPVRVASLTQAVPAPDADPVLDFLPIRSYQPTPADAAPTPPPISLIARGDVNSGPLPEPISQAPLPEPVESAPPEETVAINDPAPLAPTTPEPVFDKVFQPRTYRVRPYDTLSGIAFELLGSSQRYLEIFEANRDRLSSPNSLSVGQELVIPPRVKPAAVTAQSPPVPEPAPGTAVHPPSYHERLATSPDNDDSPVHR